MGEEKKGADGNKRPSKREAFPLLSVIVFCFWSADLFQDGKIMIKSQDGTTRRRVEKSRLSEMSASKEAEEGADGCSTA